MAYDFLAERARLADLAEQQFTNRVTVVRYDDAPVTDADGNVTRAETLVYSGRAKFTAQGSAGAERGETAGRYPSVESLRLDLPMGSPAQAGDVAAVTSSATNPHLVGLRMTLVQLERGERRTADRWRVELVTR